MAAGLGFKTFVTGEVLTAADTNGYLMQGINVFATTAARDAAITAPAEGQFAFTKDTNSLWYYDGAAWVASGATGDIEGVTAGVGISGGGTSGTVTVTNSMATAIDAKGDLVAGTGADAFSRLAVGTNNYVLTADSAQATGLKWASPSAAAFAGCSVSNSTNTSLSNNTNTAMPFNTEQFDTDSFHDTATNNTRVTIPAGKAGYYQINAYVNFNANATGTREVYLYKNASSFTSSVYAVFDPSVEAQTANVSAVVSAIVGDYFTLIGYQSSGGALLCNATLSMSYLGA